MAPKIIQEIQLTGQEQVQRGFADIGKAGSQAFEQINAAASKVTGDAAKGLTNALKGVGPATEAATKGLGGLGDASDQATASMASSSQGAVQFGTMLRLLGRAARIPELSQLGRVLGTLGRIFGAAAPLLFVAGVEKLASSAAGASGEMQDLAATSKLSNEEFQGLAAAGTAVGVSAKEMGESLKAVDKLIKDTAENTRKAEEANRDYQRSMAEADRKSDEGARAFDKIAREAAEAARAIVAAEREMQEAFANTTRSIEDQVVALQRRKADFAAGGKVSADEKRRREAQDIRKEEEKIERQRAEASKKRREDQEKIDRQRVEAARKEKEGIEAAMRLRDDAERQRNEARTKQKLALEDIERNKTALEKLGITGVEVNGKLVKAPETLLKIADALKNTTDASKRQEIEFELVAAGLDRKLLPALRQGAAEFQKLQAAGKDIRPPITPEQTQVLDKFTISLGQLGQSLAAIRDSMGAALAPAFIPFFEKLRDIFIEIRPGLTEFARVVGTMLKPVFEAIGLVITEVVIPAFKLLIEGLDFIAKKINETFGTNLTGMQLFVGILTTIALIFGGWVIAAVAIVAAIGMIIKYMKDTGVWDTFIETLKKTWETFKKVWDGTIIKEIWDGIVKIFNDGWKAISDGITQWVADSKATLGGWFDWLSGKIRDAIQWFKDLFGAQQKAQEGEAATPPQGNARGGPVFGHGTGDTVPALLTPNEYVMRVAATRKYGMGLFNALNSLRLPRNFLNALSDAGSASMRGMMPVPLRMAAGGPVPTRSPMKSFDLFLNGEQFPGLMAPEDTAKSLQRAAITRQIRSAGRKPGYYGGGR